MKRGRIFRGKVENREVCGGKGAARGALWLITKKTTDFVRKGESVGTLEGRGREPLSEAGTCQPCDRQVWKHPEHRSRPSRHQPPPHS